MSYEYWSKKMGREAVKVALYIIFLAFLLSIATLTFQRLPLAKGYEGYLPYVQAALILGAGYKVVTSISAVIYNAMRRVADHSTAAVTRTIVKIAGIAVLISTLASIFGVSASSALTIGSFSGLVIGFATQTVLNHTVAGIFIAISRPFKYGDLVTIAGKTGTVKEITIMHTRLLSSEGEQEFLIPSGKIIGEIITRSYIDEEAQGKKA